MESLVSSWTKELDGRAATATLRQQQGTRNKVDFCSNDYLGLARNHAFQARLLAVAQQEPAALTGASGSRIIRGHADAVAEVEQHIAYTHGNASALLVGSGYLANLALFSCLLKRGDSILLDEKIHRSVHDGCKLSMATKWKFRHNDLTHLESCLRKAKGRVLVAVESLYSMDGDFAPLEDIITLANRYGAAVIVDEAHAAGVFGWGLVHQTGLQEQVLATVVTYGKAFGLAGAAILGSKLLTDYLLNFSAPLIYTTGLPIYHATAIRTAYGFLADNPSLALSLQNLLARFAQQGMKTTSAAASPIQSVRFSDSTCLLAATAVMQQDGLDVYPIFSPTVAVGGERLRICMHTFNTPSEIDLLGKYIRAWQQ